MSLRQMRKLQQKQHEELDESHAHVVWGSGDEEDDGEVEKVVGKAKKFNPFGVLAAAGAEDDEDSGSKKKRKKKNKGKNAAPADVKGKGKAAEEENEPHEEQADNEPGAATEQEETVEQAEEAEVEVIEEEQEEQEQAEDEQVEEEEPHRSQTKTQQQEKQGPKSGKGGKGKGKGKAKGKAGKPQDIDQVLQEISQKYGRKEGQAVKKTAPTAETNTFAQLFATENKYFDATAEIKKLFGSKIVDAEEGRKKGKGGKVSKRFALVQHHEEWTRVNDSTAMSMELVDTEAGISTFKFVHPRAYQEAQVHFLDSVESLDPNNIINLLHVYPFHVDSLLTIAEYTRHSGDGGKAAEMIERALFCFERSFHPLFSVNSGTSRLPFQRTALEFTKLLYSLDPTEDPYCALQMMDFFALRAGEHQFVLAVYKALEPKLSLLPNWTYSAALAQFHTAKFHTGQKTRAASTASLEEAMLKFPSVLAPLADQCKASLALSQPLFSKPSNEMTPSESHVEFLVSLFVERANSLWKEPDVMDWWRSIAKEVHAKIQANDPRVAKYAAMRKNDFPQILQSLYRHVIICDYPKLVAQIPEELVHHSFHMHDPLPPPNSTSDYVLPERHRMGDDEPWDGDTIDPLANLSLAQIMQRVRDAGAAGQRAFQITRTEMLRQLAALTGIAVDDVEEGEQEEQEDPEGEE